VAQSREAAERQVVSPVEATILIRVLHAIRPVALGLEIVGDFASASHVLLFGLLLIHDLVVHAIEAHRIALILLFHLSKQIL